MGGNPTYLTFKDLHEVTSCFFNVMQDAVKVDKSLYKLLGLFKWSEPIEENADLKVKIDLLYTLLETGLKNAPGSWKVQLVGGNRVEFTAKKLKSVLLDLATIRNNLAHELTIINPDDPDSVSYDPGIVDFFINPSKAGHHINELPPEIKVIFNPELLKRKNLLTIHLGEQFGLLEEQVAHSYNSEQKSFENYTELFKYFELLEGYAMPCLNFLIEIYSKKMKEDSESAGKI